MKMKTIIKLLLVHLLLFSVIALVRGGSHGGSHGESHGSGSHGSGSHGFGTHGIHSDGTHGESATSGCEKKSILFAINQLVLVLVLEIIIALFFLIRVIVKIMKTLS
jgi:hypothetical protein